MRVIVTGSDGFIGRHTVAALLRQGHEVVGLDIKTGDNLARPIVGRLEPDAIVHLASSCSTLGSLRDPVETFRNTVTTTVNVMELARKNETPVILTSSVKARDGMTPYGASKQMAEIWAREYHAGYGVPLIINRPGTIYGPGQEGSPESGWIAWFLRCKQLAAPVTISGDGEQVRDLLHVSDYVRLMLLQLEKFDDMDGNTYDVGGGRENAVTVNEVVKYLGLVHSYGPPRYGDAREYIGENYVPGWKPNVFWKDAETFK